MTQHPADPLIPVLAKSILSRMKQGASYSAEELAQAALAAVREGHVVVPRHILGVAGAMAEIVKHWGEHVDHMDQDAAKNLQEWINREITQHDGAKDA